MNMPHEAKISYSNPLTLNLLGKNLFYKNKEKHLAY